LAILKKDSPKTAQKQLFALHIKVSIKVYPIWALSLGAHLDLGFTFHTQSKVTMKSAKMSMKKVK
jgi:hypothetical protein